MLENVASRLASLGTTDGLEISRQAVEVLTREHATLDSRAYRAWAMTAILGRVPTPREFRENLEPAASGAEPPYEAG